MIGSLVHDRFPGLEVVLPVWERELVWPVKEEGFIFVDLNGDLVAVEVDIEMIIHVGIEQSNGV